MNDIFCQIFNKILDILGFKNDFFNRKTKIVDVNQARCHIVSDHLENLQAICAIFKNLTSSFLDNF